MRRLGPMVLSFLGGVLGSIAFLGIIGAQPARKDGFFKQVSADMVVTKKVLVIDDKLVGKQDRVYWALLEATEDGGALSVYSRHGAAKVLANSLGGSVVVDGYAEYGKTGGTALLAANPESGIVSLDGGTSSALLSAGKLGAAATTGPRVAPGEKAEPSASLFYDGSKAGFQVTDQGGQPRVVVGRTSLVTKQSGVKEETPVGSITIFDEVANVVWRQPR